MFEHLAPELCDKIFCYCEIKDLKAISLTSTTCNTLVKRSLFRDIFLSLERLQDEKLIEESKLENLKYAKTLNVSQDVSQEDEEYVIPNETISKYFSNILSRCKLRSLRCTFYGGGFDDISKQLNIRELEFYGTRFKAQDIQLICEHLSNLQIFRLFYTNLTDQGLEKVHKLFRLEEFSVKHLSSFSDIGIAYLSQLVNLKRLMIMGCRDVQGNTMSSLSNLASLEYVNLNYTSLSDEGVLNVVSLKNVKILMLKGSDITDLSLGYVCQMPCLWWLDVARTRVTDTGLKFLSDLKTLTRLECWDTPINPWAIKTFLNEKNGTIEMNKTAGWL